MTTIAERKVPSLGKRMSWTHRALAILALSLPLVSATTAVAAATPPTTTIEGQNDRLLRSLQAGQAERTQAAVALARSMERNLTPVLAAGIAAAQPVARTDPAGGADVLATVLLGLVGGLVGGIVAMAGWTATTHRRLHRAASTS
jgi:hypothetical protein